MHLSCLAGTARGLSPPRGTVPTPAAPRAAAAVTGTGGKFRLLIPAG